MAKAPKTDFARISSWGPDGVRMDCEGGPIWVLEMASMQLTDANLDRLVGLLVKMQADRTKRQQERDHG